MNTTTEERKVMTELAVHSFFKSTMNLVPIAGPILSDVLFEYRPKIKQYRLNKFVDLLKDEFSKANADINIDNIKGEEFGDLLENVLNKVSKSRSTYKLEGFKNLLLHGMRSNEEINECELFSELLFGLNETDILLLAKHEAFLYNGSGLLNKKNDLQKELENYKINQEAINRQQALIPPAEYMASPRNTLDIQNDIDRVKKMIAEYREVFKSEVFEISVGQFNYSIHNLYNRGLLFDEGVGSIGTRPFEIMTLTDFGVRFLRFIKYV